MRDLKPARSLSQVCEPSVSERTVIFVRHADTPWTHSGRYQGQTDVALSAIGIDRANEVASRLAGLPIACVISSPLVRALQTATMIARALKLPSPQIEPRLTELAYGTWEGWTQSDVKRLWPDQLLLWKSKPADFEFPGGESLRCVDDRLQGFLSEQTGRFDSDPRPIVAVTHQAVMRLVLLCARRQPLDHYRKIDVPLAAVHPIGIEQDPSGVVRLVVREEHFGRRPEQGAL